MRLVPAARLAHGTRVLLDGPLPASQVFDIEVPAADLKFTGARIDVWPSRDKSCSNADKGARQHYQYAMTVAGTGAERVLRARIPPLQIGQTFCVELTWVSKLDSNDFPLFKARVADAFVARIERLKGATGIADTDIKNALSQATAEALQTNEELVIASVPASIAPTVGNWLLAKLKAQAALKAASELKVAAAMARASNDAKAAELEAKASAAALQAKPLLEAASTAETELKVAVKSAFDADPRLVPDVELPSVLASGSPGEGTTPSAGNFFTPAVGVALTYPIKAGDGRAWLFPHFGLNFYTTPVDRKIPLGQLIDQFRQRFSIIAAVSLKDVTLPSNKVETVIFDGFPYLGLGYRFTEFAQFNVGTAIYRYKDRNPTSSALHWGLAPGAGISVDLDVLAIAKNGLSSL